MIIENTSKLRDFISVNGSVDFDNIRSYLKKAERSFLKPVIGIEQFKDFENNNISEPVVNEAKELAQEVVANYGYYLYLPIGAVQVTDSGIMVVDNEHTKPASDKQFKELQRSFLTTAHEALDELLALMEVHSDKFPSWKQSKNYSVYNDLLVNNTKAFNDCFYIFNSRQTFISMRPRLQMVEDKYINPVLGSDLFSSFKVSNEELNENQRISKKYLQKTIVSFAIKDVLDSGMFILDAQGMRMRFDVLPYEKSVVKSFKNNSEFKENKKIEGEEYLKMALKSIGANLPEKERDHVNIIITPGIIGI